MKRLTAVAIGVASIGFAVRMPTIVAAYRQAAGPSAALAFEAATVKPVKSDSRGAVRFLPGGRLHAPSVNLRNLVQAAYPTKFDQLDGGPSWIDTGRYDVDATAGRDATKDEMRLMLESLLEDKFNLKVHREMRPLEVYELTAAKGGLKLPQPREGAAGETE